MASCTSTLKFQKTNNSLFFFKNISRSTYCSSNQMYTTHEKIGTKLKSQNDIYKKKKKAINKCLNKINKTIHILNNTQFDYNQQIFHLACSQTQ